MQLCSKLLFGRGLLVAVSALVFSATQTAHSQTWVNGRQGPALREILAVDATGEPNWIWGPEDVAGNGLNTFLDSEQAIDARTVYVNTDAGRFYSRVYFSIRGNDPGEITTYLFLDADQNVTTGGPASGDELDTKLTQVPNDTRGYDYVIRAQRLNNGTTIGSVYQFNAVSSIFEITNPTVNQISTEAGQFLDPIRINQNIHGYLQSSVDLNLLNLTQTCQANIFVRSTNETQNLGNGDLDVGQRMSCVPTFTNDNPNVIVTTNGCTINDECPNNGICANGVCRLAVACLDDTNCMNNQLCTDGRCVYRGGNTCTTNAGCDGLICRQGLCEVCTTDATCDPGLLCGPDGRCVTSTTSTSTSTSTATASDAGLLSPGERLQGGACACRATGGRGSGWLGLLGLLGLSMLIGRSVKRERSR